MNWTNFKRNWGCSSGFSLLIRSWIKESPWSKPCMLKEMRDWELLATLLDSIIHSILAFIHFFLCVVCHHCCCQTSLNNSTALWKGRSLSVWACTRTWFRLVHAVNTPSLSCPPHSRNSPAECCNIRRSSLSGFTSQSWRDFSVTTISSFLRRRGCLKACLQPTDLL